MGEGEGEKREKGKLENLALEKKKKCDRLVILLAEKENDRGKIPCLQERKEGEGPSFFFRARKKEGGVVALWLKRGTGKNLAR